MATAIEDTTALYRELASQLGGAYDLLTLWDIMRLIKPEMVIQKARSLWINSSWSQKYLSMIFMHPSRTMPKKFSMWYS
jgi:hypothetical protein